MTVEDAFAIRNRGVVVTGKVARGTLRIGDTVRINGGPGLTVDAIEKFRKQCDEVTEGEDVGVLFKGIERRDINRGDVLTSSGETPPIEGTTVIV
ncbi:EF-Tu/IF-2/RF-3 family GTPase [Mycobacterium deserti]|uniref:EF-Tu/IF-2/RF-3 family GTPase n=1 Tax=Mycobacterium deserti TaxID=2978347 RepID=A0ABT2M988_9MYCO|nr:EF-Tu/IF-2/RF-3 family GTPase [Mycobacterium deserti]MCT7658817.1 EF-Tu/IF-2/RF-3 family GTPase [Mycobacterium deserti]